MKYVRLDVQIAPGVSRPVIVAFPDCLIHASVATAITEVCKADMGKNVHVQVTSAGDIEMQAHKTCGHSTTLDVGSRGTDAFDLNMQDSTGFMSPLPPVKRPPKALKRPVGRPGRAG